MRIYASVRVAQLHDQRTKQRSLKSEGSAQIPGFIWFHQLTSILLEQNKPKVLCNRIMEKRYILKLFKIIDYFCSYPSKSLSNFISLPTFLHITTEIVTFFFLKEPKLCQI